MIVSIRDTRQEREGSANETALQREFRDPAVTHYNEARSYFPSNSWHPETMKESINKSLSEFFSDAAFKK